MPLSLYVVTKVDKPFFVGGSYTRTLHDYAQNMRGVFEL